MAASRGKQETAVLIENVEDQLNRLLAQLEDLEELRADLDDDEYTETKQDTLEQLQEFQATLDKMIKGDMSLVDKLGKFQLAIQATISEAFKTPEVIKLFAKREPGALRQKLEELKVSHKLQKMSKDDMLQQAVEILAALQQLGEELSPGEIEFLQEHKTKALAGFVDAAGDIGQAGRAGILNVAKQDVRSAAQP
eukprot:TRINITY_DN8952_c0_g1_i1.p1 TRINITY_DN8952_c0_g1~~TRINITY_DN8952_c0_g1_i1.p1  ORF type:complete len:195 (+),score=98.10 TRINITY_DN8952_c0_g1_i1:368-952(+)